MSPKKCTNTNPKYKNFLLLSFFFSHLESPLVGQGILTVQPSRSHSDTPYSEGPLWTRDQPVVEASICKHKTLTTDSHAPGGIRTCNSSQPVAAEPRLRPRRRSFTITQEKYH